MFDPANVSVPAPFLVIERPDPVILDPILNSLAVTVTILLALSAMSPPEPAPPSVRDALPIKVKSAFQYCKPIPVWILALPLVLFSDPPAITKTQAPRAPVEFTARVPAFRVIVPECVLIPDNARIHG